MEKLNAFELLGYNKVHLDYVGDVLRLNAEDGRRIFAYVWLSDVPHSNAEALLVLDGPVHGFLRNLQKQGALEEMALVLLSDHGARFGVSRSTHIGRHEDKTLAGLVVLPSKLLRRYPQVAVSLEVG
ncbi:hypothetical protein V5799_028449 [Amblyomma americanum]|uniref:Uncharacterized protein n=1 Tax=Amblyomma americanum TaxID=6943 RepID=A0AAQ4DCU3_AMBAM